MIFRVTQKMAKKVKVKPGDPLPPHINPLLDWTVNLFRVGHYQAIIVTNSPSLYSIVMAGRGITDEAIFAKAIINNLHMYMLVDGLKRLFDSHIAPFTDSIAICRAGDKRVLGSMNDLVLNAKMDVLYQGLSVSRINADLNSMPMSMLKYNRPKDRLLELAEQYKP